MEIKNDNIPEEILKEWIVKAKPLVDSAYNVGIDESIKLLQQSQTNMLENDWLIKKLSALKKDIK